MKKIFMMMALAAMTVSASAQGLKTFNGKLFSCQYPADFKAQEQFADYLFSAETDDRMCGFTATLIQEDLNARLMGEFIRSEKAKMEDSPWTMVGQAQIKGGRVTVRSEREKENDEGETVTLVRISFRVGTLNKKSFTGELKFLKSDEAKYQPLIDKILASFKAK